ncbi:PhzF family phenazine biosynthesis protein [Anaerotignum sp.]|nr:PhzF family phenazine biosynthesis protein [Anaerotignum sp.]MBQ7759305.1 PhzF family phenazine biosynthesis protein [Anaerotignum sp.]MBQ7759483.1 PhzF family phenazine biosynthesis protein [Anaerotignum sp.]
MKCYHVDAFAEKVFEGNPAAVCVLDKYPSDELMLKIAIENNLSETAFAVKEGENYHLRWFTPGGEIDLCGHATLGTSYVLFSFFEKEATSITFNTMSGPLTVVKKGDLLEMDFPAYELKEVPVTDQMEEIFGVRPVEAWLGRDLLCVFEKEADVVNMAPDHGRITELDGLLQHVTAKGTNYDSVSRSFCSKLAITEDPVCGSGHCHIVPFWAQKLGKNQIIARQASKRGGTLHCNLNGDRVTLAGSAVLYSIADLYVEE